MVHKKTDHLDWFRVHSKRGWYLNGFILMDSDGCHMLYLGSCKCRWWVMTPKYKRMNKTPWSSEFCSFATIFSGSLGHDPNRNCQSYMWHGFFRRLSSTKKLGMFWIGLTIFRVPPILTHEFICDWIGDGLYHVGPITL